METNYDSIADITVDRAAMALDYLKSLRISAAAVHAYALALDIREATEETKAEQIEEDGDTDWTVEDQFEASAEAELEESRDFVIAEFTDAREWLVKMGHIKN